MTPYTEAQRKRIAAKDIVIRDHARGHNRRFIPIATA
jgi:hypothetical protein